MTDKAAARATGPDAAPEDVPPARENAPVQEAGRPPEDQLEDQESSLSLARVGWSIATLGFLVAALVLFLRRDLGYAGVTLAVALSAAINLF